MEEELRRMNVWFDANPTRRKTSRGIRRFIVNWLSIHQDNPPRASAAPQPKAHEFTPTQF